MPIQQRLVVKIGLGRPSSFLLMVCLLAAIAGTSYSLKSRNHKHFSFSTSRRPCCDWRLDLLLIKAAKTNNDNGEFLLSWNKFRGGGVETDDSDEEEEEEEIDDDNDDDDYDNQNEHRKNISNKKQRSSKKKQVEDIDHSEDWEEEQEGEDEDWTEEQETTRIQQIDAADEWFDEENEEEEYVSIASNEEDHLDEEFPKVKDSNQNQPQVSLSEVLTDQNAQQQESVNAEDHGDEEFLDDAREDAEDAISPLSYVHTDEDSSAFVDRMELADAYDEGLMEEEEGTLQAEGTPSLATAAQDVSPRGGTDDDNNGAEEEETSKKNVEQSAEEEATRENANEVVKSTETKPNQEMETLEEISVEEVSKGAETVAGEIPKKEITEAMKQVMIKELHWRENEVQAMRPDIAVVVVSKKLQRPREGMPTPWYTSDSLIPSQSKRPIAKILRDVFPICLGVAAIYIGRGISLDSLGILLSKLSLHQRRPRMGVSKVSSEEDDWRQDYPPIPDDKLSKDAAPEKRVGKTSPETGTSQASPYLEDDSEEVDFEEESDTIAQTTSGDEDQSWLDKLITKLERAFKGVLNKEL